MTPDYEKTYEEIGPVRFYCTDGKWRYVHAGGEGSNLDSLEAAEAEVEAFLKAPNED